METIYRESKPRKIRVMPDYWGLFVLGTKMRGQTLMKINTGFLARFYGGDFRKIVYAHFGKNPYKPRSSLRENIMRILPIPNLL